MTMIKLSELPQAVALDGSEVIPMTQGGASVKLFINDLRARIKEDIVKELATEQAKIISTTGVAALGAAALIAKSPPVTRRFLRIFGK